MDDERFDHWMRGLEERFSRRGLSGVAAGALAVLGVVATAEAKKKKKKKGKKKPPTPSPPVSPPPLQCIEFTEQCVIGQDTCCSLSASFTATVPICNQLNPDATDSTRCCLPSGTVTPSAPGGLGCCRLGWNASIPGNFDAPGTCCAGNGIRPENNDASLCCDHPQTTTGGLCCIPSGQPCDNGIHLLCCNGTICPGTNVCP